MNWIKVTDRLPQNGQDVLIGWDTPRAKTYMRRVQAAEYRYWSEDNLKMFRTDGGGFTVGDKYAPTHWAELPPPPER